MNRDGTQIDLPQFFSWFVVEFSQTDLVWELQKLGCGFSVDFWLSSVKWTMFESCTNMAVAFQLICGQVQSNRPCLRVVKTWLVFQLICGQVQSNGLCLRVAKTWLWAGVAVTKADVHQKRVLPDRPCLLCSWLVKSKPPWWCPKRLRCETKTSLLLHKYGWNSHLN